MFDPGKHLRVRADWIPPFSITAVGIVGLADDFWLRQSLASKLDVHALFGVCLAIFIVVRFHTLLGRACSADWVRIRQVSRHLSRVVYLLLATLVLVRPLMRAGTDDLRDYFTYALASLVLIRLMAAAHGHRARHEHHQP